MARLPVSRPTATSVASFLLQAGVRLLALGHDAIEPGVEGGDPLGSGGGQEIPEGLLARMREGDARIGRCRDDPTLGLEHEPSLGQIEVDAQGGVAEVPARGDRLADLPLVPGFRRVAEVADDVASSEDGQEAQGGPRPVGRGIGKKGEEGHEEREAPQDGEKRRATDALREEDAEQREGGDGRRPDARPRPILRETSQPGSSASAAASRPRAMGHQGARSRGTPRPAGSNADSPRRPRPRAAAARRATCPSGRRRNGRFHGSRAPAPRACPGSPGPPAISSARPSSGRPRRRPRPAGPRPGRALSTTSSPSAGPRSRR